MPNPAAAADALADAIDRAGAPACIGLDPVLERLPPDLRALPAADAILAFCTGVIDACAGLAPAVKPQSACFERYGHAGVACLERVIAHARDRGFVVVLDAKRGDIGSTSAHYAAAAADAGAHWVTVNAYLGPSGIEPFLAAGLGVFALVRTSNPDSDQVQAVPLAAGGTVGEHVASLVAALGAAHLGVSGLSGVGAVVGATKAADAGATLRSIMPDQPFLVPGVGAQGGSVTDLPPLARPRAATTGRLGLLVNASRSILYPPADPRQWQEGVRDAARAFADALTAATGGRATPGSARG